MIDPKTISGLSVQEAASRLAVEGYNELPSKSRHTLLALAVDVLREPMILLLVACGAIYLVLGDTREALLLVGSIGVIIGISLYQGSKTERALEALHDLSSPRALVIRDGQQRRIPGREVVRGDSIVLAEGDRVPADGVVRSCSHLAVDESLLTGESMPVGKRVSSDGRAMERPGGGDDQPCVYAGTLVVQGQAIAEVLAIGLQTEMGTIGKALQTIEPEDTRVQREVGRVVRVFAFVGISLCVFVAIVYGITHQDWLHGLLAGLTLAISMIPEELPVVLTVFLALGAWRISRRGVLTRRVPAVEMLGAATVLCADKTGTLTLNRMTVQRLYAQGHWCTIASEDEGPLPEHCHELAELSILASHRDPFDPTEQALQRLGSRVHPEHLQEGWTIVREYPMSRELLAMSHVRRSPDGRTHVVAAKGAPEAIAEICRFSSSQTQTLAETVTTMARDGLRVLGVAKSEVLDGVIPDAQREFTFQFVGLVGLVDPVRPAVPDAIKECQTAGIRVVMMTGDYPATAQHIASHIGLSPVSDVISGKGLDAMDEATLRNRIRSTNLFARIVPEQKLRLVNAFKANGEVVAMTGDGVNDAPALKAAHIGIAMGARGTDVAREAAALVLLDDDFSSIVHAIRLGRRVFDNLKKAMAYIFAVHVPIAGLALIPVLFHWPLILLPVHIVFLELIIDPVCSIVFEAEPAEANVMTRPPRHPQEPLFGARTVILSLLQGMSVLLIVLAVFVVARARGHTEGEARALTFTTLIIANLALILTNRSWSRSILSTLREPNAALWWVMAGALTVLALVLSVPWLRELFRFAALHMDDLIVCLVAGTVSILWFEGLKVLSAHRNSS
ncbi:MAG: cation-translocating P-type ATPase [Candidatus Omnitrophica bacterium]|nr:cation-translocating P-type ATPase [Candidatus Omnitrophota bacterium]